MRLNALTAAAYVAAGLLSLVLASPAAAQTAATLADAPATSPAAVAAGPKIRIDNFGRVSAAYYRGEQPKGGDYADLAALGIKTVIDLQADGDNLDEDRLVAAEGMTFYRIPMTTRVPPDAAQIAAFLDIVNDPAQQPVFVHCAGGKHRTGVMTAVFRMTQEGWNADQAFSEMKRYKFGADFLHPEFKKFVFDYSAATNHE